MPAQPFLCHLGVMCGVWLPLVPGQRDRQSFSLGMGQILLQPWSCTPSGDSIRTREGTGENTAKKKRIFHPPFSLHVSLRSAQSCSSCGGLGRAPHGEQEGCSEGHLRGAGFWAGIGGAPALAREMSERQEHAWIFLLF